MKITSTSTIVVQPDAMMQGLGFVIRDEAGRRIGAAAGYTWAGTSELKQMWSMRHIEDAVTRGHLLNAFIEGACSRGVRRIWVASYDFQAPGMHETAGFKRMAELEGWPEGHSNVISLQDAIKLLDGNLLVRPFGGGGGGGHVFRIEMRNPLAPHSDERPDVSLSTVSTRL